MEVLIVAIDALIGVFMGTVVLMLCHILRLVWLKAYAPRRT